MVLKYNNPLLDKEFLRELDEHREKEQWAKIIALTVNEEPVEEITGQISGGNIGLDGSSSVRRTCSLQMVPDNININNYYWGLKNKFKLEIGLTNRINPNYPDIIWFPQGTYVITQFNTSHTINNYTISIQGQDKMCLLNGTVGGSLTALSHTFDSIEDYDNETDEYKIVKIPIQDIIREMVHEYAQEPYHNIIINDLDEKALELLEYRADYPMWMFVGADGDNTDIVINATISEDSEIYIHEHKNNTTPVPIWVFDAIISNEGKKEDDEGYIEIPSEYDWVKDVNPTYSLRTTGLTEAADRKPTIIRKSSHTSGIRYYLWKIVQGDTVGYRETDIIYPSDLIESVGTPITQVLDKLKNMLGNFEYFYDDDGRFVFQKKKTYTDTSFNNIRTDSEKQQYIEDAAYSSATDYTFEGNRLISSFSNSPNLNNVKNDYSIWGVRKSVTGNEIPVHLRYAIDKKPFYYKTFAVDEAVKKEIITTRKITDQKVIDKIERKESKEYYTAEYNKDKCVDWRELIYQMAVDYNGYSDLESFYYKVDLNNRIGNEALYPGGYTKYQHYYTDMLEFWRTLYNTEIKDEEKENWNTEGENIYWSKQVTDAPETLDFWFDFLDFDGELAQFSVPAIGNRPKAINDNDVKGIYFKETPNVVFIKTQVSEEKKEE